jgi:dynein intermediate chain 2
MQSGKAGRECVSTSTDGQVLWWDMRQPDEPIERHTLDHNFGDETNKNVKICGGTSMEWNNEAGPGKFLIGTEQGVIMLVNKKQKKIETNFRFGTVQGRHHGPVYRIERNPHIQKYFMSVGDWQAKMWCEEGVFNPIM